MHFVVAAVVLRLSLRDALFRSSSVFFFDTYSLLIRRIYERVLVLCYSVLVYYVYVCRQTYFVFVIKSKNTVRAVSSAERSIINFGSCLYGSLWWCVWWSELVKKVVLQQSSL